MRRVVCVLIVLLALASVTPRPQPAHAAGFVYRAGYSVQFGWLCYGWPNGAYHCTQHWAVVSGRYVSYNAAWTPSQGAATAANADREPDGDGDDGGAVAGAFASGTVSALIQSAFSGYAGQALRIAQCESGLNPYAVNRSSGATGVFQFMYATWLGTPYAGYSRTSAWANVQAAHWLFVRDGYSWRAWSCGYILGYV